MSSIYTRIALHHSDMVTNKTANLWYRTHYPEPRVMCPSVDTLRPFTLKELYDSRMRA